jgi:hypothetical protein
MPSLRRTCSRCLSTVRELIFKARAISLLDSPRQRNATTRVSVGVNRRSGRDSASALSRRAQRCWQAMEDVVEATLFFFIRAPWRRTVSTLMPSCAAMALLLMPRVTSSKISSSRGVRALPDPVRVVFNEFVAAILVYWFQNLNELPRYVRLNDILRFRVSKRRQAHECADSEVACRDGTRQACCAGRERQARRHSR